jgi:hypothetical protein
MRECLLGLREIPQPITGPRLVYQLEIARKLKSQSKRFRQSGGRAEGRKPLCKVRRRKLQGRADGDPGSVGSAISRRERRIIPFAGLSTDGNRRLRESAVQASQLD